MEFKPHDYQKAAIDFLKAHKSSALLLDCGLGKTIIVLTAIKEMRLGPVLVVAPKLVVESWVREVNKWDHLKDLSIVAVQGTEEERVAALKKPGIIHVISRDNISWLSKICNLDQFAMLVMDESSSFKDETSARTQALIGYNHPRKVIMTGTPIPKNIEDLYSQYKILDGGRRLGPSLAKFRKVFMDQDPKNRHNYKPKPGVQKFVFSRVQDITISMQSAELLDLPPLTTVKHEVEMTPAEQAIFWQLANRYCLNFDGVELNVKNSGILTNKLAQLSNGFFYDKDKVAHTFHRHKTEMLESLLESSACNGEDVIVAYNYDEDRNNIARTCKELGLPVFDMKENADVESFIRPGDSRVAMLHPSGGMGLNLQEYCHRLIWYSLPYSYEQFYQTLKRVYRQGQKEHTFIHNIETLNSYDQRIKRIVSAKGECNDELLRTTKWIQDQVAAKQAIDNFDLERVIA